MSPPTAFPTLDAMPANENPLPTAQQQTYIDNMHYQYGPPPVFDLSPALAGHQFATGTPGAGMAGYGERNLAAQEGFHTQSWGYGDGYQSAQPWMPEYHGYGCDGYMGASQGLYGQYGYGYEGYAAAQPGQHIQSWEGYRASQQWFQGQPFFPGREVTPSQFVQPWGGKLKGLGTVFDWMGFELPSITIARRNRNRNKSGRRSGKMAQELGAGGAELEETVEQGDREAGAQRGKAPVDYVIW